MKKLYYIGIILAVLFGLIVIRAACIATGSGSLTWPIEAKLTAKDASTSAFFGNTVSLYGDTAIVGDTKGDAAYVFIRNGKSWKQQAKLTAPEGAAENNFGDFISVYGDTAAISGGSNETGGAVYIFTHSGSTWTQQAKLTSPYNVGDVSFGDSSISLYENTVIIGAENPGEADVFTRSGTTWTQQATLTAQDGVTDSYFGNSVSIYEDTAIVGAVNANAAYVFTRSDSTWTQQAQLSVPAGTGYEAFGCSVSLFGDTAIIGAETAGTGVVDAGNIPIGSISGAAYIFTRSDATWTQQAKLTQLYGIVKEDIDANELAGFLNGYFGAIVSLYGDTAVIYGDAEAGGAAFVFTRDGTTWTRKAKLSGQNVTEGDLFGADISIYGNKVIVGYPGHSALHFASITSAAYVYDISSK